MSENELPFNDIIERLRDPFPSNRDAQRKEAAYEIEQLQSLVKNYKDECNELRSLLVRLGAGIPASAIVRTQERDKQ